MTLGYLVGSHFPYFRLQAFELSGYLPYPTNDERGTVWTDFLIVLKVDFLG